MKKISLNVNIPSIGKVHDFIVPDNMSIKKITQLMAITLVDEYGITSNNENLLLINLSDNTMLNGSCSLKQLSIKNGSKLMLF